MTAEMKRQSIFLPVETISENNLHEHFRPRVKRRRGQRETVAMLVRTQIRINPPMTVTLVRISPRSLDDDNLAGAFKAVRDGIADALGIDDASPLVRYRYRQEKPDPKPKGTLMLVSKGLGEAERIRRWNFEVEGDRVFVCRGLHEGECRGDDREEMGAADLVKLIEELRREGLKS